MNGHGAWEYRLESGHYDLKATLDGGQAFRWRESAAGWEGVVGTRWVRLRSEEAHLGVALATADANGIALAQIQRYLGLDHSLEAVLKTFPDDAPLRAAQEACRGLRLLRQEPWECLASFICSSTKQIVQIQQIVELLSERYGEPVEVPAGHGGARAFPSAARLARCTEQELRACKLGFRAPYLLGAATAVTTGALSLETLASGSTQQARDALMTLPGVGRKIADCVLLFAYGRQDAFPVDVWVQKALQTLYFPGKRRRSLEELQRFSQRHFGSNAGYAQQYLFHYVRAHLGRDWSRNQSPARRRPRNL